MKALLFRTNLDCCSRLFFEYRFFENALKEKRLLKRSKPWGIILFSRNIRNVLQLKNLISSIKKVMKEKNYPILIDQEGGKVSRLNKIIDLSIFSQDFFGKLYKYKKNTFHDNYKVYINSISNPVKFSIFS